jgi:hypothetical protein
LSSLARDCRPALDRFEKNTGEVPREAPGLPQSEIAGNEKHYHNNTNYVKNIVHVSFSFLSRDRVTVELHALSATERKGRREASLVVLPSDEAQWELTVSDIIRISVLHPGYAFKPLL